MLGRQRAISTWFTFKTRFSWSQPHSAFKITSTEPLRNIKKMFHLTCVFNDLFVYGHFLLMSIDLVMSNWHPRHVRAFHYNLPLKMCQCSCTFLISFQPITEVDKCSIFKLTISFHYWEFSVAVSTKSESSLNIGKFSSYVFRIPASAFPVRNSSNKYKRLFLSQDDGM